MYLNSFVGRRTELAAARRLLGPGRVLTVAGPPGVGKSRFARRLADRVSRAFPDGVTWLSFDHPASLPDGVTRPPSDRPPAVATGARLFVLDGCEHMLAHCADLVRTIIETTPGSGVLITSRYPLAVPGEQVLRLPPLPCHGPFPHPGGAEHLFEDRARAVVPSFAIDDANRATVSGICRLLDGLPLAIELTARWLRTLPLAEILRRLETDPTALDRSGAMAASIARSHHLCTPAERDLWMRLSVFADGFDQALAEIVASDTSPLDALVDRSIVLRTDGGLRLPAVLRGFGLALLDVDPCATSVRERHRDHFLDLAKREALRDKHLDLRTALEFSLGDGKARAMAEALFGYWQREHVEEGLGWLARSRPTKDTANLWMDARLAAALGDGSGALALARRSLAQARHPEERGLATYAFAGASLVAGDLATAAAAYGECVALLADSDLVTALAEWAVTLVHLGDHATAERLAQRSLAAETRGDTWARGRALYASAAAVHAAGDLGPAEVHAREAVRLLRSSRDPLGESAAIELLAWIAVDHADHHRAARLFGSVQHQSIGSAHRRQQSRRSLETARRALGDAAFDAAFAEGARRRSDTIDPRPVVPSPRASDLTSRETEVAELLAIGLSNKEIAAKLVISVRTAETHVNRVLVKLGCTSRFQVAAWQAGR
ncbi:helix-turn-helix transcriptional regulator [Kutzneria sp. CA-103260]|uniref:helix-turn-helix transcriptional regulator n=1 Tax=Kutzneria sp. CA-103260 TaxID=2802641 RepID=UPI001BAB5EB7|nr:LuxR C-terminal-related transcriptional regulator [Kutzneria sp. CA-103260]QUQ72321.1 LuxR family transcriptional regulator [Kutzneria sp. CA-103260]